MSSTQMGQSVSRQWRKKPVVIEAAYLPKTPHLETISAIARWCDGSIVVGGIAIATLEGTMLAEWGDYVICGVKGEFYPCKPDIFEATYEPA